MIAGQQTQAAGVDGHAFVDAELRGEIGHAALGRDGRRIGCRVAVGFLKPGGGRHVVIERFLDAVHMGQKAVVARELLEAFLARSRQQLDGAVFDRLERSSSMRRNSETASSFQHHHKL